jgi:hypothetical protein
MQNPIYRNIAKLIERDSKFTTYKFALLRGVIEIVQDNSNYISSEGDVMKIPLGLLIEKWMLYYYPLLESKESIPQIHGSSKLQFEGHILSIISYYSNKGGLSVFYNDIRKRYIPLDIKEDFINLAKKLQKTITDMPMKYIGQSINKEYYSIFNFEKARPTLLKKDKLDIQYLIDQFGYFTIPLDYYDVFQFMGTFINGQESIIMKWADFSVNASKRNIAKEKVIEKLSLSPITDRDSSETKNLYASLIKTNKELTCVWTGRKIKEFDIDHIIPFSIWKNNDLWNLLPSDKKTNNQKRDKIPSPDLILERKTCILTYWDLLQSHNMKRFEKEIEVALLGEKMNENWGEKGIINLIDKSNYLINNRGYEEWKL